MSVRIRSPAPLETPGSARVFMGFGLTGNRPQPREPYTPPRESRNRPLGGGGLVGQYFRFHPERLGEGYVGINVQGRTEGERPATDIGAGDLATSAGCSTNASTGSRSTRVSFKFSADTLSNSNYLNQSSLEYCLHGGPIGPTTWNTADSGFSKIDHRWRPSRKNCRS